ncbi:MAG: NFACT family protein, partial [Clostridia bacterium]|nr:NFACT family protein [Clostridia bacterium]
MALDGIFINFLVNEISENLIGSKVDKIHQPTKNELVLIMRSKQGMFKLFLTADANAPRFHIIEKAPENPQTPPMLCMLLRKKLVGATLTEIEQFGLDRVVLFKFNATNEIGDKIKLTLAVEIMAQHSNIILINEENKIVDAIKRVDAEKSSYRLVLPGAIYKLPPEQNKLDIRNEKENVIFDCILNLPNVRLSSAVLKTLQGVSPLLSREIAVRVTDDDKFVNELSSEEKERLLEVIGKLKVMVNAKIAEPNIILDKSEKPLEFSFLPILQYGNEYKAITKNQLSELLDGFYSEKDRVNRTRSKASELFKQIDSLIERTVRKLNNRREELKKCADRDEIKIKAELITASQYMLNKGDSVYEVYNYYDNNALMKIDADPALTPSQNAQKYYKEYKKACTAENMLIKLVEEGESELEYLESVKDLLLRSTLEREFNEIKEELASQGFLKAKNNGKKQMKKASLPPLEFKTSQGLTVLVGRNNTQNDKLTFKTGRKGDIWLHAQKSPGSHVLLVSDGNEVPDDAIVEA